jgi:paraquat-inducible protein B
MTDPVPVEPAPADEPGATAPPQAETFVRGRLSSVWLIPVIAVLVAGWLGYKTWSEKGPTVTIVFKAASGLQVGKTVVKFKDVEVGKVTGIRVADDLKGVLVTAELVAGTEPWLTKGTRFWIARARVAAGRVSGLETLLSGAFIEMDPQTSGERARRFVGLEEPPLFRTDEPGRRFVLRSDTGASLTPGSPVYYRGLEVGQVASSRLDDQGATVEMEVFISAPYDKYVRTNSRFWNVSGLDVSLGADGVRVETASFLSLFLGGVAFDTPPSIDVPGPEAEEDRHFLLYPSRDHAHARVFETKKRYLMYFDGSVRGLSVGAPVLMRGIQIGKVLDVRLDFDIEKSTFEIPVLVEIEPERINLKGNADTVDYDQAIAHLVSAGLRGQLQSGSLVTGQLYVELGLHPEAAPASMTERDGYKVVPTVPAPLDVVVGKVNSLLDTLGRLPLEQIGADLRDTLQGLNRLVNSERVTGSLDELPGLLRQANTTFAGLNKQVVPETSATMTQMRETLATVQGLLAGDSAMVAELMRLLRDLSAASRSIKDLADYLERHPDALIKGKGKGR